MLLIFIKETSAEFTCKNKQYLLQEGVFCQICAPAALPMGKQLLIPKQ
jgi:hypothetical protein